MADDIEHKEEEVVVEEVPEPKAPEPKVPLQEETPEGEIDYQALAEAEKARADAAEALIIKNKQIEKRHERKEGEEQPSLTREEVLELIKSTKSEEESSEARTLREAQEKVKLLQAQRDEIIRAARVRAKNGNGEEHRDGELPIKPKLPDNSPLKEFEWRGGDLYAKKLTSGKTMFRRANPRPGEKHSWIE